MSSIVFQLLRGAKSECREWWTDLGENYCDFHRVYWIRKGICEIQCNDVWTEMLAGNLYFIPGHTVVRRQYRGEMAMDWMHFRLNDLDVDAALGDLKVARQLTYPGWEHWDSVFNQFTRPKETTRNFRLSTLVHAMLNEVIAELVGEQIDEQRGRQFDARDQHFLRAIAFMDEHAINHPDLAAVASQAGVSANYFHRRFRALYRLTPRAYMERIRMARAWDLLAVENIPVGEVSRQTGYTSAYYFSRAFRRYFGRPPSEIRGSGPEHGP